MEIKYSITDEVVKRGVILALDNLTCLYGNRDIFLEAYKKLPPFVLKLLRDANYSVQLKKDLGEYLYDYCKEMHACYLSAVYNLNLEGEDKLKLFTLRNFHDLQELLNFLNKIIYLYKISPGHFMDNFLLCPEAYWDKIDDLRETSFKYHRDSDDFIECLEKCKKVSFLYSSYIDYLRKDVEEWM